ncbi:hypothetical protein NN561_001409 [Cricetulus griseus]
MVSVRWWRRPRVGGGPRSLPCTAAPGSGPNDLARQLISQGVSDISHASNFTACLSLISTVTFLPHTTPPLLTYRQKTSAPRLCHQKWDGAQDELRKLKQARHRKAAHSTSAEFVQVNILSSLMGPINHGQSLGIYKPKPASLSSCGLRQVFATSAQRLKQ